jgi:phospholipid/cholesterol/gamma-HCH transport system ATP-binding protein
MMKPDRPVPADGGDILIDGQSTKARKDQRAQLQRKLGVMYQSGALFGSLTTSRTCASMDEFTAIARRKNLTARMLLRLVEMGHAEALMPAEPGGCSSARDCARDGSVRTF